MGKGAVCFDLIERRTHGDALDQRAGVVRGTAKCERIGMPIESEYAVFGAMSASILQYTSVIWCCWSAWLIVGEFQ